MARKKSEKLSDDKQGGESQQPLPDLPNFCSAIHVYFPDFLAAFLGIVVVILVSAFADGFTTYVLFLGVTNQDVVVMTALLAGLLFLAAVHHAYRAQADNVTHMSKPEISHAFRVPINEVASKITDETVLAYLNKAERSAYWCVCSTYAALAILAVSIAVLILSYSVRLGMATAVLFGVVFIWLFWQLVKAWKYARRD